MLKFTDIARFHSLAEYFYSALLEGDPLITRYVPQPFRLRFGRKVYIPDIYVECDGQIFVRELKARGDMNEELKLACESYFRRYGATFEVIDNDSVFQFEMQAQNWLTVIQWILTYEELDTHKAELQVIDQLLHQGGQCAYGDIADLGDRESSIVQEVAVHRLLHRGELSADFDEQFFNAETQVQLCL